MIRPETRQGCLGGFFGMLLVLLAYVVIGLDLRYLPMIVDPASLALVLFALLGHLLIALGPRDAWRAYVALVYNHAATEGDGEMARRFCRVCIKTSILIGLVGLLIGTMLILAQGLDSPKALCGGIATALLALFYGLALSVLFTALRMRAEVLLEEAKARTEQPEKPLLCHKARIHFSAAMLLTPLLLLFLLAVIGVIAHRAEYAVQTPRVVKLENFTCQVPTADGKGYRELEMALAMPIERWPSEKSGHIPLSERDAETFRLALEAMKPSIRDWLLNYLTRQTATVMDSPSGRQTIRDFVKEKVNARLELTASEGRIPLEEQDLMRQRVRRVLITRFHLGPRVKIDPEDRTPGGEETPAP